MAKDGCNARVQHGDAELCQVADDAQVSPSGILPGQAADEFDGLGREPGAARLTVGVGPVSSDEAAVQSRTVFGVTRNAGHRCRGSSPESGAMTARSDHLNRGRATWRRSTVSW